MAPYPHPIPVGNNPPENNDLENENAIPNDHAVEGNDDLEDEDAIPNGHAVEGNDDLEDENAIPNDNAFGRNNDVEDEIAIPNGHAIRRNNDLEDENDVPNDNEFRGINFFAHEDVILPNDRDFRHFNFLRGINEPRLFIEYRLFSYTLEHIKNVLYVGLHQLFNEFEISVVSCPCLTRSPYNLAAIGLSGNTSYLRVGGLYYLTPNPQTEITYDIRDELLKYCHDSFIIGAGYAAKPSMLHNGLLTMNATVLPPENVNNNSRIVYEDDIGHLQVKRITDSNEMVCSMLGNFFFSEGRRGIVIKMRAKGRKNSTNIMLQIQNVLIRYCRSSVVLGGVFLINGGEVKCKVPPENYPMRIRRRNIRRWLKEYLYDCENLIVVGALVNTEFDITEQTARGYQVDSRYKFHIFSKDGPAGIYKNDITAEETEYIAYFNVARTAYL